MTRSTHHHDNILRSTVYTTAVSASLPTRDELLGFLLDPSISHADLQTTVALLVAANAVNELPKYQAMKRERTVEKHCVRCHALFTDESNKKGACAIPHVFDLDSADDDGVGWGDSMLYASACCGSTVELEETAAGNGHFLNVDRLGECYQGYHTDDMEEVEEDEGHNRVNILRCHVVNGQCVREVLAAKSRPLFEGEFEN